MEERVLLSGKPGMNARMQADWFRLNYNNNRCALQKGRQRNTFSASEENGALHLGNTVGTEYGHLSSRETKGKILNQAMMLKAVVEGRGLGQCMPLNFRQKDARRVFLRLKPPSSR